MTNNPYSSPNPNSPDPEAADSSGAPETAASNSAPSNPYSTSSGGSTAASSYEYPSAGSTADAPQPEPAPSSPYASPYSEPGKSSPDSLTGQSRTNPFPGPDTAPTAQGAFQGAPVPPGEPAPGSDLGNDFSKAFSWAFRGFGKNLGAFLGPAAVWFTATVVLSIIPVIWFAIAMAGVESYVDSTTGETFYTSGFGVGNLIGVIVFSLLALLPAILWATGAANAAGMLARGEEPTFKDGLVSARLIPIVIVSTVLIIIGSLLLIVPGLIAAFFLAYAVVAAATDRLGVGAAIKASARTAMSHALLTIAIVVVLWLLSSVASAVVLGTIFFVPIFYLLLTATYARATGRVPSEKHTV